MENAKSPELQQKQAATEMGSPPVSSGNKDRRFSDEWDLGKVCKQATNKVPDAAKVPPSRFQKRKGSIYATPSSRDGHVDKNYAEKYHAKIAEMKAGKAGRSTTSEEAPNKKQQYDPIAWGGGAWGAGYSG